jgi:hypothetical protein
LRGGGARRDARRAPMADEGCRYSAALTGFSLALDASKHVHASSLWPHRSFSVLAEAQAACLTAPSCGGVTQRSGDAAFEASSGSVPTPSPTGGSSWVKLCGSSTCEVEQGAWYWGVHLRTVPGLESAEGCCDACLATPACVSYNFGGSSYEAAACALYSSRTERHADDGFVCGVVRRAPSPPPPSPPSHPAPPSPPQPSPPPSPPSPRPPPPPSPPHPPPSPPPPSPRPMPPSPRPPPPPSLGLVPGTPLLLRASCSSLVVQWEEAAQPSRVLEYAAFFAPLEAHQTSAGQLGDNPTRIVAPPPPGAAPGKRGTRAELSGLHAGTNYTIVVRARTPLGWGPPSEPLLVRTRRPKDFPAPIPAPRVLGRDGCGAVKLRLPPLESCAETPPTRWDVEVARGAADDWRVLVPDTPGGFFTAVGMDAYTAARFRVSAHVLTPGSHSASTLHSPLSTAFVHASHDRVHTVCAAGAHARRDHRCEATWRHGRADSAAAAWARHAASPARTACLAHVLGLCAPQLARGS